MHPAGPVLGYLSTTLLFPISAMPGAEAKRESLMSSRATCTAAALFITPSNNTTISTATVDTECRRCRRGIVFVDDMLVLKYCPCSNCVNCVVPFKNVKICYENDEGEKS